MADFINKREKITKTIFFRKFLFSLNILKIEGSLETKIEQIKKKNYRVLLR